jgi:hypothetical protein
VLVTNDISEAISLSDRILVLSRAGRNAVEVQLPFKKDDCPLDRRMTTGSRYFDIVWKELDGMTENSNIPRASAISKRLRRNRNLKNVLRVGSSHCASRFLEIVRGYKWIDAL